MDTFSDGKLNLAMSSMFVPDSVMSLAIKPAQSKMQNNFAKVRAMLSVRFVPMPFLTPQRNLAKALNKFTKEDPTLRVKVDSETKVGKVSCGIVVDCVSPKSGSLDSYYRKPSFRGWASYIWRFT